MFCFFCIKNPLSRVVWTVLAFLSYNLQGGVSIWLCHGELLNSLWILDLLSPFYLLLFQCYKWSLSSFNVKFFASVTSSVTSSSFSSQLHSLFMLIDLSSLNSSDCRSKVSWMVTVPKIPTVNYFFCFHLIFIGISLPALSLRLCFTFIVVA